jgi:hypothetical protein
MKNILTAYYARKGRTSRAGSAQEPQSGKKASGWAKGLV